MNAKLLAAASFLVTAAVLPKPATAGQPPGLMPDLPGVTKSKAEAYWMAPYVLVSEERIGKRGATMVTWFNEDGMIKRQTEVSILEPGYVVIISRRVDCDHPVHSPLAAPEGTGALLRPNTGGTNQNTFLLYTREGK